MTSSRPNPADPASTAGPRRRDVLRTGAALAALAPALSARGARLAWESAQTLRVGLVGCGGRGTGAAANALRADPNVELVAVGDVFVDHAERCLETLRGTELGPRVKVDPERVFVGFDAYRDVIAASDVVLLATTPHFRPQHVRAAVEAAKHLFVEKPVATDAPGLRSVEESCRMAAAKGLSLVSGLCYRYERAKRETLARVHDGAVGEIAALECTYNTGGLWHRGRRDEWSEMEYQIRNWLYFTWLSGDFIVEQHIHSLDKLLWAMGDRPPVAAVASGGRAQRTGEEYGNVYDHFNTVYEWADGVRGFSSCRQMHGTAHDVSDRVYGTQGVAHLQTHKIEGAERWRWRSEEPDDMYQNEHDALFASIRAGEPIDDGAPMCNATRMALLARMAAYTGQRITWEQAGASLEDLSPPAYAWGEVATRPVAVPGVTKFV